MKTEWHYSRLFRFIPFLLNQKKLPLHFILILLPFMPLISDSQQVIPFSSDQWQITSGQIVEHDGRQCLLGSAYLKDLEFQDGVIEVDMWFSHERSYPGIMFRIQTPGSFENLYIRPHRSKFYPDAIQYTPSINGIRGWQLYSGQGYTASYDFPFDEWVHFRLEVSGDQALLFINDSGDPALVIHHLQHGTSKGAIGLESMGNAPVFFSDFSSDYHTPALSEGPGLIHYPTGMIREWEISIPYPILGIDLEKMPEQQSLPDFRWKKIMADTSGLVDVAWYYSRTSREPECIFARTFLYTDEPKTKEFRFGYSDAIRIFLNGQLIFTGNSAYQQRDPSFLGIIGLNDGLFLPLKTGKNELLLMVAEGSGGWGFMLQDAKRIEKDDGVTEVWSTPHDFLIAESVLFDPKREVLYVSNYDQFHSGNPVPSQFISKISPDGEILELKWVNGLHNPLGMTFYNDMLYVADRKGVVMIDPGKAEIIERIDIPDALFLNDIAVDVKGSVYVSDSRKSIVWKCDNGECKEWLSAKEVTDPNVLYIHQDHLLVGCSGDQSLKSFDLGTREMTIIARLGTGFIDGIRPDLNGNLLVSHWEGRLFKVSPDGQVRKILDISGPQYNLADFEYVADRDMIYIPTFFDNRVLAYKVGLK